MGGRALCSHTNDVKKREREREIERNNNGTLNIARPIIIVIIQKRAWLLA